MMRMMMVGVIVDIVNFIKKSYILKRENFSSFGFGGRFIGSEK
jgi:hypothetical protein